MRREIARLFLLIAAPAVVVVTIACSLAFAETQQSLRGAANDPQVQLAEDGARSLGRGAAPGSLVAAGSAAEAAAGPGTVDLASSLAPFVIVYDRSGAPVASNATLDGRVPVPPLGVLASASAGPRNQVTWQPRPGVRIAAVAVAWTGGTVLAGRSLRLVEEREDSALGLAVAAWAVGGAALVVAVPTIAWMNVRRSTRTGIHANGAEP
jgi:hypothetical protein